MNYTGIYINLDRSEERRVKIEAELARNGLGGRYKRFSATDGNAFKYPNPNLKDAEIGCFTSHLRVLQENRNSPIALHIIEDDILLSKVTESVIDQTMQHPDFKMFDIVYTDIAMTMMDLSYIRYKRCYDENVKRGKNGEVEAMTFTVVNMEKMLFCSTCSLIINPHAFEKLISLYEQELTIGARMPIDIFILTMCQKGLLKIGCIFPFITSIAPENCFDSTIHSRSDYVTIRANNLLRYSFFTGADLSRCAKESAELFPQIDPLDHHNQFLVRMTGFLLSDKYGKI